jgi:hypothetical protein
MHKKVDFQSNAFKFLFVFSKTHYIILAYWITGGLLYIRDIKQHVACILF